MTVKIWAVGRPEVPPRVMPDRFRHEITYFMTVPGEGDVPALPAGEYWVRLSDAQGWLDAGSFEVVSPLDGEHKTEIELSEEQEGWLEWLVAYRIERQRVE